jgi:hypothetical protein
MFQSVRLVQIMRESHMQRAMHSLYMIVTHLMITKCGYVNSYYFACLIKERGHEGGALICDQPLL